MVLSSICLPLVPSWRRGAVLCFSCVLPWHGEGQLNVSFCLFPYWIFWWLEMLEWESINCYMWTCMYSDSHVCWYVCVYTYIQYVCMYVLIVCFLYVTENNIYMEEVVSWRFRTRGPNIWISVWTWPKVSMELWIDRLKWGDVIFE